jgi:hypothetical protein
MAIKENEKIVQATSMQMVTVWATTPSGALKLASDIVDEIAMEKKYEANEGEHDPLLYEDIYISGVSVHKCRQFFGVWSPIKGNFWDMAYCVSITY